MEILICGNGFSLLKSLKDRSLDDFDKVVRVNDWTPIEGYDNRCDAWIFYPRHSPKHPIKETKYPYDFTPYLSIKELWLAHSWDVEIAKKIVERKIDYVLGLSTFRGILSSCRTYVPCTGIFAIHMAIRLSTEVYLAGFDFYEGETHYYHKENIACAPVHKPEKDKVWVLEQIKNNKIKGFL